MLAFLRPHDHACASYLARPDLAGMRQGENIGRGLPSFLVGFSLHSRLCHFCLRSLVQEIPDKLQPLLAALDDCLDICALLIGAFVVILFSLHLDLIALALPDPWNVWVANEDPRNLVRGGSLGREALQEILDRLGELPCIQDTSVWIVQLRDVAHESGMRDWSTRVDSLLLVPSINVEAIDAVLQLFYRVGIACIFVSLAFSG